MSKFTKGDKVRVIIKDDLVVNGKPLLKGTKGMVESTLWGLIRVRLDNGDVFHLTEMDLALISPQKEHKTMKDLLRSSLIEGLVVFGTAVMVIIVTISILNAYY
jgi:hypothetical protein